MKPPNQQTHDELLILCILSQAMESFSCCWSISTEAQYLFHKSDMAFFFVQCSLEGFARESVCNWWRWDWLS